MTSPRARIWTNNNYEVTLTALGAPGQKSVTTLGSLRSALDISHLVGYTIIETWIRGYIAAGTDETGVLRNALQFGVGIYAGLIDDGDFPRVDLYEGDWMAWGSNSFRLPGVAFLPVLPEPNAIINVHSKGQRRINDVGETVFMVLQEDLAATIDVNFTVTHLLLMP